MAGLSESVTFLRALDPTATSWTFQTFDDDAERKDRNLATIRHGTVEEHFSTLAALNDRGAGIFFMANRGDGLGRAEANVVSVRALFVDLDGAPLDAVRIGGLDPHVIVQTSLDKWHCWWLVDNCSIDQFKPLQQALAKRFDGDPAVCDLPRVMRLPGFDHRKNPEQPHTVHVIDYNAMPAYSAATIVSELGLTVADSKVRVPIAGVDTDGTVTAGARHGMLLSFAGRLRELGTNREEILDAISAVNQRRCQPPKSEGELIEIAAYVAAKPVGDDRFKATAPTVPVIESAAVVALQPAEVIEYDIFGIAPATDAPVLMYGPPASLKSWLALAICDAVVRGEPFLDLATRQRTSALYLNLDAGAITFRNRVRSISDAPRFDFVSLSASEYSHDLLRSLLADYRGGFVVIDCLSSIYNPDTKSDPAFAMRAFVDGLRAVFAEFDCGGLIIDHPHRPKERGELGDYHGSIQKEAAFRTMWSIAAEPPENGSTTRRTKIICRKLSEGAPFSPIEVDIEFGSRVIVRRADAISVASRTTLVESKILEWAATQTDQFSRRSVVEKVRGQRAGLIRDAFDDLVTAGKIIATGKKRGNGDLYRLSESGSGTHSDPRDPLGSGVAPSGGSGPLSLIGDPPMGTHSGTHPEELIERVAS